MKLFLKKTNRKKLRKPTIVTQSKPITFSYQAKRARAQGQASNRIQGSPNSLKKVNNYIFWLKRLPTLLTTSMIVLSFLYAQSLQPNPRLILDNSTPNQTNLLRPELYQASAQAALRSSILNRSKLTVRSGSITARMKKEFPEIQEANLELSVTGRRPVIRLKIATAAILLISRSSTYIVDERGRAIANANNLAALSQLSLVSVTDESGLEVHSGSAVLTNEEVHFMQVIDRQLRAKKVVIQSMSLPPLAKELRVRLMGQPYYVRFNLSQDPRQAAGSLLAAKAKLEADHTMPTEYIDARLDERVYYK